MEMKNYYRTGDRVQSIKTGKEYTVIKDQTSRREANIWVERDDTPGQSRVIRWRQVRPA